jgi:chromosome segregation ATPase
MEADTYGDESFEVSALLSKLNAAETRARNAEHDVTEQQAKLIRLVEAVKEERKATKEGQEHLQRKFLEERERADQLENKLLQLIQAIKKERENQKAKEIEQQSKAAPGIDPAVVTALREQFQQREARVAECEEQLVEWQTKAQLYQTKAETVEAKLTEQTNFSTTLQDKMQQLIAVTRNVKKELDEAKEKLDQRTRSTSQAIRNTGALEAKIVQLTQENAKMVQENKALQEQLEKLQIKARERSPSVVAQHRDLDSKVQQLEMSLTKETTRATQAEASVTDLTNKLRTVAEALKSEREQFKKEVSMLTARVTEKESSASEWDRKIKLANVKIEEQESHLNAEQNKSQELQRRVTQLERELVQKNTETPRGDRAALNELEERLREAEDRAANAEALVSELEGELARYENQEQSYETEPQQYETPVSVPDTTPPPPMVGGGPPPPPPPPPPMAKASFGALKINRKPKTGGGAPKAAPAKVAPPGPQSNIVDQLKRGVSLRKTEGPQSIDEKVKAREEERKKQGGSGDGTIFSLANIASDLAKQRAKRMMESNQQQPPSYHRASVRLDNLLAELGNK